MNYAELTLEDVAGLSKEETQAAIAALRLEASQKKLSQGAIKVLINSAYGATASRFFRLYDKRLCESITMGGQTTTRLVSARVNAWAQKEMNNPNLNILVAGDTDSIYLNVEPIVEKYMSGKSPEEKLRFCRGLEKNVQRVIDKALAEMADQLNTHENVMNMARENITSSAVFIAKKKYALKVIDSGGKIIINKPKLKVTGLEMKKGGVPKGVFPMLERVIYIALDHDELTMQKYIVECRAAFEKLPIEMIAQGMNVGATEKYMQDDQDQLREHQKETWVKGTPAQTKGAIIHNMLIDKLGLGTKIQKIGESQRVRIVNLKLPNPTLSPVIAFQSDKFPKEFMLDEFVDRAFMFDKNFLEPTKRILTAIGWKERKVKSLNV